MKKYMVEVTESINHQYEVEADSEEEALLVYGRLTTEQLISRDLDGGSGWDTPWEVREVTQGGW